jgi:HEAT repeat protein
MDELAALEADVEILIEYADGVARADEVLVDRRRDLVWRNPRLALEVGQALMASDDPDRREMGVDLIGVAAQLDHSLRDHALPPLRAALDDAGPGPLSAAIIQLELLGDESIRDRILPNAGHPDEVVRHAVAFALPSPGLDELALDALIGLTRDVDDEVRDWATFGLAELSDADNEAIRGALLARVEDDPYEIRVEAIVGLARRQDERVRPHLVRELSGPDHADVLDDALEYLEQGTGRHWQADTSPG